MFNKIKHSGPFMKFLKPQKGHFAPPILICFFSSCFIFHKKGSLILIAVWFAHIVSCHTHSVSHSVWLSTQGLSSTQYVIQNIFSDLSFRVGNSDCFVARLFFNDFFWIYIYFRVKIFNVSECVIVKEMTNMSFGFLLLQSLIS